MNILVIDDHRLFLDGFLHLLSKYDRNIKAFAATNSAEALQILHSNENLEFILLDLSLPGLDGVSFLGILGREHVEIPVAIVSAMDNPAKIRDALNLGAVGFIPKSFSVEQMHEALDSLLAGKIFIPPEIHALLSQDSSKVDAAALKLKLSALNLRSKQFVILQQMADGKIVQQISKSLNISPNTVKTHIKKIYLALNVNSRVAAISEARRLGLLD